LCEAKRKIADVSCSIQNEISKYLILKDLFFAFLCGKLWKAAPALRLMLVKRGLFTKLSTKTVDSGKTTYETGS
jgi:hypothetical protein